MSGYAKACYLVDTYQVKDIKEAGKVLARRAKAAREARQSFVNLSKPKKIRLPYYDDEKWNDFYLNEIKSWENQKWIDIY